MLRRVLLGLAALAGLLVVLAVGAIVAVGRIDLAGFAAGRAAAALGRPVTIGSLRLTPGRWLGVELAGLSLGNIPQGSRPQMVTLDRLSLEVEVMSLLRGPPVLRAVTVDGLSLLLERAGDAGRTRNWRFGPPRPPAAPSTTPDDRSGLPMLQDASITNSEIVFRTTQGLRLVSKLDTARLAAAGVDAPVTLRMAGSYNAVPVTLDAALGSMALLRDATQPYATTLRFVAGDTTLDFDGTMTDPLNVDGARGRLVLHAPGPQQILAIAGAGEVEIDASLNLEGQLLHAGPVWRLSDAKGRLAGEPMTARRLEFAEGKSGEPDSVSIDLGLGRVDLNRMVGKPPGKGQGQDREADLPLAISRTPDPLLDATITASSLAYSGLRATDLAFAGVLRPGQIAVENLALTTYGARFTAAGRIDDKGRGSAVAGNVRMEDGDLDTLRRAFGLRALPLSGRLDAWVAVAAEAATLNGATREARVSAVVAMRAGQIAREVIEVASIDLRRLFRKPKGMTPVACLLGMVDMRAGRGVLEPLRVRSGEGTITGSASFDINTRQVDLVIGSQANTTDFFALDIPVRVSGAFADPRIRPAKWSAAGRARLAAADDIAPLPPLLRSFAQQNPCYWRGAPPASARPAATPRRR